MEFPPNAGNEVSMNFQIIVCLLVRIRLTKTIEPMHGVCLFVLTEEKTEGQREFTTDWLRSKCANRANKPPSPPRAIYAELRVLHNA